MLLLCDIIQQKTTYHYKKIMTIIINVPT